MARFNTEVLRIEFNSQRIDRRTGSYSGTFTAWLGCTACELEVALPVQWPPAGYEGPPSTSPEMLDNNVWIQAGTMASELCPHVDKTRA